MASKQANDTGGEGLAFSLTRTELLTLMKCAVDGRPSVPLLVDKQSLACSLSVSPAHIDNLRKRGLPVVRVGEAVRFEPAEVLEWLRRQGGEASRG